MIDFLMDYLKLWKKHKISAPILTSIVVFIIGIGTYLNIEKKILLESKDVVLESWKENIKVLRQDRDFFSKRAREALNTLSAEVELRRSLQETLKGRLTEDIRGIELHKNLTMLQGMITMAQKKILNLFLEICVIAFGTDDIHEGRPSAYNVDKFDLVARYGDMLLSFEKIRIDHGIMCERQPTLLPLQLSPLEEQHLYGIIKSKIEIGQRQEIGYKKFAAKKEVRKLIEMYEKNYGKQKFAHYLWGLFYDYFEEDTEVAKKYFEGALEKDNYFQEAIYHLYTISEQMDNKEGLETYEKKLEAFYQKFPDKKSDIRCLLFLEAKMERQIGQDGLKAERFEELFDEYCEIYERQKESFKAKYADFYMDVLAIHEVAKAIYAGYYRDSDKINEKIEKLKEFSELKYPGNLIKSVILMIEATRTSVKESRIAKIDELLEIISQSLREREAPKEVLRKVRKDGKAFKEKCE